MRQLQLWSRLMTVSALRAVIQANALGSTIEKVDMVEVNENDDNPENYTGD